MTDKQKQWIAYAIVVVAILVAGFLGVTYPVPAPPVAVSSQGFNYPPGAIYFAAGGKSQVFQSGSSATYNSGAQLTASSGSTVTLAGTTTMAAPTLTGDVAFTGTFKNTAIPMTGSATRPLDFRSAPTTTSYLNTELAYFRADLDKNLNEAVSGEDGFTVGAFRGYVGATNLQGAIIEGLRSGVNLDAGALVNDPLGAGYIAGARITTYVPATANAKTNKGLIVAPRDDTAEAAISGSQYIGEQIYLKQGVAKDESWGLDIYSESGSANLNAAISLRNGGSEKYGYGVDMNDMSVPGGADIRLSQGETIDNLTDGTVNIGGTSPKLAIAAVTFTGPMKYGVSATYVSSAAITHGFAVTPTACFMFPSRDVTETLTIGTTTFSSDRASQATPVYWMCGK